jgi:hypothetical protein
MHLAQVGQAFDPYDERFEFILAPGQTPEQLDAMRKFICDLRAKMERAFYLMTVEDAKQFDRQDCVITVDGPGRFAQNFSVPRCYPFPGQSAEQLAELVAQLERRLKKERKEIAKNAL